MKNTIFVFIMCLMAHTPLCAIKNWPQGQTIKLLLAQEKEGALVEVKGAYNVYNPLTSAKLDAAFASSSYYLYPTKDGIKWGEEFPGVFQIMIVPDSPATTILVSGIELKGAVYAYQSDAGIGFINEVSLDDYVASILSNEALAEITHPEVLATLAIAARTDALYKSQHPQTAYWAVKAADVRYTGFAATRRDQPFVLAMESTSNMLLNYPMQKVDWFQNGRLPPLDTIETMAEEGKDAKDILTHLFPDKKILLPLAKSG